MKQSTAEWARMGFKGTLLLIAAAGLLWVGVWQVQPARAKASDQLFQAVASASSCPAGRYCSFVPLVENPVLGDLVLSGIEVTQAVQNPENSLPLVAGRRTMLRIYTYGIDYKQAVSNVKISLQATSSKSAVLASSPQVLTATVPLSSSRASYGSSINIPLPVSWLSGTIDLTVRINSDNKIAENNSTNDSMTHRLVFNAVPPLQVRIVPVLYHNSSNRQTYSAPSQDKISDWIMRTYPISQIQISWHAPYEYTGDLSTSAGFNELLNAITTLKSTEGAPSSLDYYGLIPTQNAGSNWFNGGLAGLGWIGSRTAIGLDYEGQTSQLAAHEIGHNLGMWHTPCGGAASPDPQFPYSDGTIGQYGLDVSTGTLYPPSTKDVMGYCDPKWVSDYTYQKLYSGQVKSGASAARSLAASQPAGTQRGLLVRANIYPDRVEMLPAYVLPGQVAEAPEPGTYEVQVLDEQGEVLEQTPVRAYELGEDSDIKMAGINTVISLPDQPAARLRLLKDGQVLAEQALAAGMTIQAAASPVTVERAGNGYHLHWDANGQPALVRYSADGGKTWTTLGVDMKGSEMSISPAALPDPNGKIEVIPAGEWK